MGCNTCPFHMGKMSTLLMPRSILSVIRITTGWSVGSSQMNDRHVRVIQVPIHSYFKLNWHWGKCCISNFFSHTLGIYNWFPWRSHACITKASFHLAFIWQWNLPSLPDCSYRYPKDETLQLQVFLPLIQPGEKKVKWSLSFWTETLYLHTLALLFPAICLSLFIHINGVKKVSACNYRYFRLNKPLNAQIKQV